MKKRPSVRMKYLIVLIGVVAAVIIASLLSINLFLETYYIKQKEQTLIKVYDQINADLSEKDDDTDTTLDEEEELYLTSVKEKYSIETSIWDSSQDEIYSSGGSRGDGPDLAIMEYILGRQAPVENLISTDNYQINKTQDKMTESYYLEMFASYDNGCFSIMRTPMVGIQTAIRLVNRFLLYTSLVISILGFIAAYFLTRNMIKPIKKMAEVAEKMSEQDFSARAENSGYREFEQLGNSMNHMAERLEKAIVDLKSANIELQKDIEQKTKNEEMRREFLSNVSHELKTPIALIQGYAEGLKEGITDDPESSDFYCDVIIDEAAKMNQMVRKLLTLNQIESSTEQINLEHFDLIEMIRGVLNSYQIMIQQKDAHVSLFSPEKVTILADEYMAEEVIRNYIGNALNHLDGENNITIRVEKREKKVHVEVFNNGTPIPEESLSRLWDKFYKVDKARTREYGGSGIGLSIVKAVMETHGCDYGVRNEKDGVTFWCEFDI